jgi:hypothetical protein
VADIQWRIYSSRYIYSGRYTAVDTVPDIQYRIKIHIHSGRYTMADIYTVTDIQPDIQYQVRIHIHSGGYTEVVQDTQHDIHSSGYIVVDEQQQIQ